MMTAIIPARGGSKGVKDKNLRPVGGRALVQIAVDCAEACPQVAATILSSDAPRILAAADGAKLTRHLRSADLSSDRADVRDLLRHLLPQIATEYLALLQPTSPFRTAAHLTTAIEGMLRARAQSCVAITEAEHPASHYGHFTPEEGFHPLVGADQANLRRQDAPRLFRINGAIYIARVDDFARSGDLRCGKVHYYEMSKEDSLDIDYESDLHMAEFLHSQRQGSLLPPTWG